MSRLFRIDGKDLLRGLVVTVITAILSLIVRLIESKGFNFDATDGYTILSATVLAGLSYLSKNLLTTEDGKLGGKLQIH